MSNTAPLDFTLDLNEVETSYPVLVEGSYIAKIADITREENKTQTGHNLKVVFATTAPATSLKGVAGGVTGDVPAGLKLSRYYPLQASQKSPDFDFRKGLAQLQDACLGTEKGSRPPFDPAALIGREVVLTVKVREDKDGPYAGQQTNDVQKIAYLQP